MLGALPVPLIAALALGALAPAGPRAETAAPLGVLVRFTCDSRDVAARMERTVWSADRVREELARGWTVDVREGCAHALEFEELVGERGVLASCALDRDGSVLGVLRGPQSAGRCVEFLAACRAELGSAPRPGARSPLPRADTFGLLEWVDVRIELGAWKTAADELECRTAELSTRSSPDPMAALLAERLARVQVLRGEVAAAAETLALARRAGLDSLPLGRARGRVTALIVALAARRLAEARALVPRVVERLVPDRCEHAALLSIARVLHESGEDTLALDVCAALDASDTDPEARFELDRLREHVLASPPTHTH